MITQIIKLSEKYLQKIIQDDNRHGSDHLKLKHSEIIRYGLYCKLEGQLEELRFFGSELDIKIEDTLKYMAKNDLI